MWNVLKTVMLGWFLRRSFGMVLGLLVLIVLLLALVLTGLGMPFALVLLLVGVPLLVLLVLTGLPRGIAVGGAGAVLGVVGAILKLGLLALKIALPIVLVVCIVRWLRNRGNDRSGESPA